MAALSKEVDPNMEPNGDVILFDDDSTGSEANGNLDDNKNGFVEEEEDSEGFDDYDGHNDDPTEPATEESSVSPTLLSENNILLNKNQLSNNDDFIAFSDSSNDEKDILNDEEVDESINVKTDTLRDTKDGENKMSSAKSQTISSDFPWIVNHDHSKQTEVADWLTLEIQDFVSYISPNRAEIEARNSTIGKVREAVKSLWPDADLLVFGSYATDLYLPGSDIDCVVNSKQGDKEKRSCLYSLATHLRNHNLATEVEIIAKARVPIIKFVEPASRIHIDVSFERTNGLEAAKLIRDWLDSTPGLRELVLIIKQFLHSRRLNNVHTGGLGGFTIICLVYSFLHMHPRVITGEINSMENLGVLLIDFFELYGKNFGYDDVAISMTDGIPSYISKYDWKALQPIRNSFALAIQDPGDPDNNISRGSFNIRDIKKAFAGAFDLLTNRCFELDATSLNDRVGKSILGNVIKYKGKQRDFKDERNLVLNKAIIENEDYHKKRSRTAYETDETAENNSNRDDTDTNAPKKRKKSKKPKKLKKVRKSKKEQTEFVADNDDDTDSYNPLSI